MAVNSPLRGEKRTSEMRPVWYDAGVIMAMLLASDAFMHANYEKAISLWRQLLDSNSPRINRSQLIEAINMATIMKNNH